MKQPQEDPVPEHRSGVQSNTESGVSFDHTAEAERFFEKVKGRLLQVNGWQSLAGPLTARFQLTDAQGQEVNRVAQKGDHFKIDIPGPGSVAGDGFDWVHIEEVTEEESGVGKSISIRVRPAPNPTNDSKEIAHFFSEDATSCFVVKQEGATVSAAVYGRNEKPNTDTEVILDKARNTAIAAGAMTAFSKLQWKSLVNGLVKKD